MLDLTTSYLLRCYHYLSLGSPRSRAWDKKSIASSLFGRWFQEKPVGEWGQETGKGRKQSVFSSKLTLWVRAQSARDSGSQHRTHAQSYPTTGTRERGPVAGVTHVWRLLAEPLVLLVQLRLYCHLLLAPYVSLVQPYFVKCRKASKTQLFNYLNDSPQKGHFW